MQRPALTGLRGAAALWVAGYHLLLPASLVGGLPARMLGRGYLAVDLFFVLSGYVLALNYGERAGWASLPGFLWRRWARIFPLYGLILVVRLTYTLCRYGGFGVARPWVAAPVAHPWTAVPANLLLVQSWGVATSITGPAWSVSVEWAAYCVFPVLVAVMLRGRPRRAMAGGAAAFGLVLAVGLLHAGLDVWDGRTAGPLLRCLGGFTLGLGMFRLSCWQPARRLAASDKAGWLAGAALLAALAWRAPDLAVYPMLCAVVLCAACGQGGVCARLAAPGIVRAGELSYAIYLLHIFLLHPLDAMRAASALFLPSPAADGLAAGLVAIFLFAAATLAHDRVEQPARVWLTRLAGRARPSLTCTTPAFRNLPLPKVRVRPRLTGETTLPTAR